MRQPMGAFYFPTSHRRNILVPPLYGAGLENPAYPELYKNFPLFTDAFLIRANFY